LGIGPHSSFIIVYIVVYIIYLLLFIFFFHIVLLLFYICVPSVIWHCSLGGRKGIHPVKIWGDGGGGLWLVRMEWLPAGWSVCLPLFISPCTIKSTSSLLAPDHPGGPGKRAVKRLWLWCGGLYYYCCHHLQGQVSSKTCLE